MNDFERNFYEQLREQLQERFEYWQYDITDDDVLDFSTYDLAEFIEKSEHFYLYQYRTPKYYNIRNFEKQRIHLSENGSFNDVYEGLPTDDLKNCSSEDISNLYDLASIACFTETNNNQLMWSHYADSHKGFCVEYDLKLLPKDSLEVCKHLFPVLYGEKRIINYNLKKLNNELKELREAINKQYVYDDIEYFNNIIPLFITKGTAWAYEKEWRVIYTKKDMYEIDDDVLYSCNIPFSCISAVYLGYRIDKEVKENIIEICRRLSKERNISVFQEILSDDSYEIKFIECEI